MGQEKERQTLKTGLLSREDFLKQVLFCSFHVLFLKYLFTILFVLFLSWAGQLKIRLIITDSSHLKT